MDKKGLLLLVLAVALYVFGVCAFSLAVFAHVWHILACPTYLVTASSFVLANLIVAMLFGAKKGMGHLMSVQSVILLSVFFVVKLFVPVCALMTNAIIISSLGMLCLGLLEKVFFYRLFLSRQ